MTSTRISRREFLQLSAGATAGAAIAGSAMGTFVFTEEARAVTTSARLAPFADPLPIPPPLTDANPNLLIQQTQHQFNQALSPVPVWGYNGGAKTGGYLGPTIVAQRGTPKTVTYKNDLLRKHLLNVDPTLDQMKGKPTNSRILTHLHGGHISDLDDGNPYAGGRGPTLSKPNAAIVPDYLSGDTQSVTYPNAQESAHLWYHDHALGVTRLNVMAGLAGVYLLRDSGPFGDDGNGGDFPDDGKLPSGVYEVPLVIQDRAFAKDGRIKYPAQWTPEFFGDVVCINGMAWPFHNVEPRQYRMRILNGSNSRFYNLTLTEGRMIQIGGDGGFLPSKVEVTSGLLIAPGERADVIFDFTGLPGADDELGRRPIKLVDNPIVLPTVSPATPLARTDFMEFRVGKSVNGTDVTLPTQLRDPEDPAFPVRGTVAQERFLTLEERLAGPVPTALVLNGMRFGEVDANGNRIVTEKPKAGETEVWSFVNISADTHPMHVHLPQFEVIERRKFLPNAVNTYAADLAAARAGQPGAPPLLSNNTIDPTSYLEPSQGTYFGVDANERGPKDTVRANPAEVTSIKVKFELPAGETTPAQYVWHCHILEHEENDMMRPYDVV